MADQWYKTTYENKHDQVNEFVDRKRALNRSHRTLNSYSRVLREFFHKQFPEYEPHEIGVREIEEYVQALDDRGVSQNTKKKYLEVLSSFYGFAMKRPHFEEITGNPAAVVLEDISRVYRERPDCATWESACQIIQHIADPRDKTVAILLAKTGCRVTEALSIEMDDLMLDEGFLRLRVRKGGGQTVVPLDDETILALRRYKFLRDHTDSSHLFVNNRGQPLGRDRIRRSVKGAAARAGIAEESETRFHKKFTPHTFRTVFTTLMRNQGMSLHVLKYIRGDANTETMDIYTRIDRDQAQEEYRRSMKQLGL